jgi:hypothetical protein
MKLSLPKIQVFFKQKIRSLTKNEDLLAALNLLAEQTVEPVIDSKELAQGKEAFAGQTLREALLALLNGGQVITPPTPAPAPTLVSIALTGPDSLNEGQSGTYSVIGTYSSGTTAVLNAGITWSSNAPSGVLVVPADTVVGNTRSLTVTASVAGMSVSKAVTILDATAAPVNQAPSVILTGATQGTVGTQQNFQPVASDPDGTVAKVELLLMANATTLTQFTVLDTDLFSPYVLSWTPSAAGSFNLRARVTDNKNATGFSDLLPVAVAVPAPAPITLASIALTGPDNVSEGTSGTYSVTGTYSNGTTGVVTSGITWSANAPGGVLAIAADQVVGNNRTLTVVATVGSLTAQRVVQILDATTAPAPVTLTGIALTGPNGVNEGTSGTYAVVGTYSNTTTAAITSGITWGPETPGGVLTVPADSVYGNSRTVTVTASVGSLSAQRLVQVLDATAAPAPDPLPDAAARRQTVGIFDVASNTLVATPVIDEPYSADPIAWDGMDFRGNVADVSRAYEARPISNAADLSVAGTWKGVAGNNSDSFTGPSVWGSGRPSCMAFMGGKGRYGVSYIERDAGHCHFVESKPGARVMNPNYLKESQAVDAVCSDAERTYHAGVSFAQVPNPETGKTDTGYFITATNNSDESPYTFAQGYNFHSETLIYSAIDVPQLVFVARGIDVQQAGRVLASLHPDRVVFFDKVQAGPALGEVLLDNPTAITFLTDTVVAILHSATTVELYSFDAVAFTLTSIRAVPLPAGFVPRSMDVSPVAPTLSILCGETDKLVSTAKHRILHYDTRNYDAAPRVEGKGDLSLDPLVTDDTFCFYDTVTFRDAGHPYLAYQEDGSYWFMDDGNKREQHRAADGTVLYMRYCAGTTYNPTADITNPSRLFNDFLEYEIDHTKEKIPANTNNWWKLKYNRACFRQPQYDSSERGTSMTTFGGRTFSMQKYNNDHLILCEWRTTAPGLRFFPEVDVNSLGAMDSNGDLLEVEGFYPGETKINYRRVRTGFVSADGPPTYAARVEECRALLTVYTPNSTGMFCGPTTDGTYPCFALALELPFHMGGLQRGARDFRFATAPSTWTNYMGPFPSKGEYDVGNGVWGTGTMVIAIDNYFIYGYRGEHWKNGQTTKFTIIASDGRYIGQFGTVRDGAFKDLLEPAAAGQGGNAITFRVVKVVRNGATKYVLMHGDENAHGGFHFWEFDLSSVKEHAPYAIVASTPELEAGVSLMGEVPFDQLGFGSGATIGNWKTMGAMRAETSRLSRTSINFIGLGGGRAYAPFPVAAGDVPGYMVQGYYAWPQLGGYNGFYYPIAGMEFKDTSGLIYLRLAHNDDGNGNTVNTANGMVITTGVALVAAIETAELRPFELEVAADGTLLFGYNGREKKALPVFSGIDPDTKQPYQPGNPLRPGTVELNFTAFGNGDLKFAVDQFRFLPSGGSTPAPDPKYAASATATQPTVDSFTYEGPLVVSEQTGFTGPGPFIIENRNFRNDNGWTIEVNMPNGQEVIIRNCAQATKGTADLVHITNGSNVTAYNNWQYCDGNQPIGVKRGRGYYTYNARRLNIHNNYQQGVAGNQIRNTPDYTGTTEIKFKYNRIDNVCGGEGAGGEYCQILQLVGQVEVPNIEVAWNQGDNDPYLSRVEDNYNLFETSGTVDSPLHVHDNFTRGGYPTSPGTQQDSGSGLTTDAGGPTVPTRQLPHNILVNFNQFVGTNNAGMNIAAGYNVTYDSNRMVNSATLADGTPVAGAYSGLFSYRPDFGAGNPTYSDTQFFNNKLTNNYVNFKPHPFDPVERGSVGPGSTKPGSSNDNNTYMSTATYADEVAEFEKWKNKLSANRVLVGPNTLLSA